MSEPIFLDKCRIYQMEVFMHDLRGGDHASVGMRKPSGEYERPIPGSRLYWTKPGNFAMCLQHGMICCKQSISFVIVKR